MLLCPHSAKDCSFFGEMERFVDNKKIHQKMQSRLLYKIVLFAETDSFPENGKTKKYDFIPMCPHNAQDCQFFVELKIFVDSK